MNSQNTEATESVTENRRVAGLLGFLLKGEVDAAFQQQPFKTTDGRDPLEVWQSLDRERQGLSSHVPGMAEAIPVSLQSVAAEIASRSNFKKHYQAVADYSFAQVPIDSLIAPQCWADVDYIQELATQLGLNPSAETQMQFAFAEGRISAPIVTANQVQFISPCRDLYADPIPAIKETSPGSFEIVVHAASRPNYVQVALIDGRLVLTNGVHKVCALYTTGFKTCFCLIRTAANLQEAGLNPQLTTLFRDALFRSARPALVRDFLDPRVAASLHLRSMYQIMQVSINVGIFQVPALPIHTKLIKSDSIYSRADHDEAYGHERLTINEPATVDLRV